MAKRDWADEKAEELLPCRYGPQSPISSRPQLCTDVHIAACPAWWRSTVAQALRDSYGEGVEAAAKVSDQWHTGSCNPDKSACDHNRLSVEISTRIRALIPKKEQE